jgi:hypothetical protein
VITTFASKYEGASKEGANEVVLSSLRADRKAALRSLFGGPIVTGWTGKIRHISTDSDGTARLAIDIPCGAQLRSDAFGSETGVTSASALYRALASLHEGNFVSFDARFVDVGERRRDWLEEQSLTERGSMTDPEFIVAFQGVSATTDPARLRKNLEDLRPKLAALDSGGGVLQSMTVAPEQPSTLIVTVGAKWSGMPLDSQRKTAAAVWYAWAQSRPEGPPLVRFVDAAGVTLKTQVNALAN